MITRTNSERKRFTAPSLQIRPIPLHHMTTFHSPTMGALVAGLLALLATGCAPLPLPALRAEGAPVAASSPATSPTRRSDLLGPCMAWRSSQRGWAIVGAASSSIAGAGGLGAVVMPHTDNVTLTLGLVVVGASALAAGAGVAVTYLSADYAAAGCAGAAAP